MGIGERIKNKRIQNNLTLLEISELLGVSEATVQRYESGKIKTIKLEYIEKLADILHTTPTYLLVMTSTKIKLLQAKSGSHLEIGERIKKKRKQNNITLLEISELLGVSEATVQRYESGKIKTIKLEYIKKLADILHTTPTYLLGYDKYYD